MKQQSLIHNNSPYGTIQFDLDKLAYIGSETIEGNLHIDIHRPYKGHVVVVSLEGVEKVVYPTSKRSQQDVEYGVKRLTNNSKPVYDFAANSQTSVSSASNFVIQPGQWSIPFKLKIHPTTLQTINLYRSSNNYCSVNFYISAYVVPSESNQVPISGKQSVLLVQNKRIFEESYKTSLKASPNRFCFLGTGKLQVDSFIERTQYCPGDQVQIRLDYNFTQFQSDVSNFLIKLVGKLIMRADFKEKQFTQDIEYSTVSPHITSKKGSMYATLLIPSDVGLSQKGSLHQLDYYISIEPQISDKFVSKIQQMKLPLQIQSSIEHLNSMKLPTLSSPFGSSIQGHGDRQEVVPQNLETLNFDQEDFQEQYLYFGRQDTVQVFA